jgi:hypothetical protein
MGSKRCCRDVLIALRMLVDVVGQGLESVTGERLHGVTDDGHLTCGNGEVSAREHA